LRRDEGSILTRNDSSSKSGDGPELSKEWEESASRARELDSRAREGGREGSSMMNTHSELVGVNQNDPMSRRKLVFQSSS